MNSTFSPPTLEVFRRHVARMFVRDLGIPPADARPFVERAAALFVQRGEDALPIVREDLERQQVADRWRTVLAEDRTRALADWISNHARGDLLDLCAGTGRVAQALAYRGHQVTASERGSPPSELSIPFIPFSRALV